MKIRIIALTVLVIATIFVIAQSLPISQFPNVSTPLDSDLFVLAQTQAPKTNKNIRYDQLRGAIRSGMATETYVNNATNGLATTNYANQVASNRVVVLAATNTTVVMTSTNGTNFYAVSSSGGGAVLWTNSGGFVMLTTNGPVSIASTGLLGGLVVTQDIRFLGHNSASNSVWVCTNATTGEGEWRTAASVAGGGGLAFDPNTNLFNLQYEPVRGSTWYAGTNGTPTTNEARAGFEHSPFWRSIRMGQVNGGVPVWGLWEGHGSNSWNNTNIGVLTAGIGSNAYVKGHYSSVLGGANNAIGTNANFSVIGGGVGNLIDTNSRSSVIGGGGRNGIRNQDTGNPATATIGNCTIGGGSNNVIGGTAFNTLNSTIGGGGDNLIEAQQGTIGGGFANEIQQQSDYAFIGGGLQNAVGVNGASANGSDYSAIAGGRVNGLRGIYSFIGGGRNNLIHGTAAGTGGNYNVISGGASNDIGIASFPSTFCFVGSGHECNIADSCDYSSIVGGRNNSMGGNNTNAFIGGGRFNMLGANEQFGAILGGQSNTVNGTDAFVAGGSRNSVTADGAGALGQNVTNGTANSTMVSELISYNTPSVIAGAGSGSTNYTLQVTSPKMLLGSSNVNIVAVMQTISGKTHNWNLNITNLSADTWGISFSSATNRWKFQSWMYGTNAPSVLTNNTLLRLQGESEGTNTLVTYQYFSPAL